MKAYKHLVQHALAQGFRVTVGSEGEVDLTESDKPKAIYEAIEALEEADLVFTSDGNRMGWSLVSAHGLAESETVIDHSLTEWLNVWSDEYFNGVCINAA